jgi:hypothetical protein
MVGETVWLQACLYFFFSLSSAVTERRERTTQNRNRECRYIRLPSFIAYFNMRWQRNKYHKNKKKQLANDTRDKEKKTFHQ